MEASNPQRQGREFEENFRQLLDRLLKQLGFEITECRIQPPGAQYGKDIQVRWRDESGDEVFWQFECKSHTSSSLPSKEVADKLFDLMRSSHGIDVWCLTLANAEPSSAIDETFAWIEEQFHLPFGVEVLSGEQHGIERLFACEPDLYAEQYGEPPAREPSDAERAAAIDGFATFLREATKRARKRRAPAWEVVDPSRMVLQDNPESAVAYLRGLRATAPWEAVANGWATWRGSSVAPLVERILDSPPGFDFAWLIAAGGEGKSTAMRQVAWEFASEYDGWKVVWSDESMRAGRPEVPVERIKGMGAEANVLVCIDGSGELVGAERLHAAVDSLADGGRSVFVLFADRGAAWKRSRLPGRLSRGLPRRERRVDLQPLSDDEAADLVGKLESRRLLHTVSADGALDVLKKGGPVAGTSAPWLLPTLMQLTDPQGRGFEGILESVVGGLEAEPERGALLLLLAAGIVQSAGKSLPRILGERLVRDVGGLGPALDALTAELETQFGVPRTAIGQRERPGSLVTHHRVIAEGFVTVAAGNSHYRERFLEACDGLPATVAEDVDQELLIPPSRFQVLDSSLRFLEGLEERPHDAVEAFLQSLLALDGRQFPMLCRLGDCYLAWLRDELKAGDPSADRVEQLADAARAAYRQALSAAGEVLGGSAPRPRPYVNLELARVEEIVCHAWGTLENTIGQKSGETAVLKRTVMLFLQALRDRGTFTLARPLIHLGLPEQAAQATAAYAAIAKDRRNQANVRAQKSMLRAQGQAVPAIGVDVLDELVPKLVLDLLLDSWEEIGLYETREQHVEALLVALRRTRGMVDTHERIDRAIERLGETSDRPSPGGQPAGSR